MRVVQVPVGHSCFVVEAAVEHNSYSVGAAHCNDFVAVVYGVQVVRLDCAVVEEVLKVVDRHKEQLSWGQILWVWLHNCLSGEERVPLYQRWSWYAHGRLLRVQNLSEVLDQDTHREVSLDSE
jgi:hypothetical protein